MSAHVLIIVSNHGELAGEPNGTYLPELTHAVHVLNEAGIDWTLASPEGGAMPHYAGEDDEVTQALLGDDAFKEAIESTEELSQVDLDRFDALFYPGGYGLLFDLVENAESQRAAAGFYEAGKPVAAVCHGPAALSQAKLSDGTALIADREVTGFTYGEEVASGTLEKIPFLLEEKLLEAGATYSKRGVWESYVIEDGRLIHGQNPASAAAVGEALAELLQEG